ncbi:unnamed protein product [Pseudo-nitzschia multistriata]|uniref:FCP1 homology domain-containing protein n=1 Tax=Pseudo-nitzschia multistriata TaxID=183589 RepID=A0A448ZLK1_9STRA|nr:unnamed protein product [Pseudo-nitzschia multistriata]
MTNPPAGAATPSRNPARHNYANTHTPIASAKRPRSSMDKSALKNRTAGLSVPSTPLGKFGSADANGNGNDRADAPLTPVPSMVTTQSVSSPVASTPRAMDRANLSPMHPARPTIRSEEEDSDRVEGATNMVDAIFSPMLKLLGAGEAGEEEEGQDREGGQELEVVAEHDEAEAEEHQHRPANNEDPAAEVEVPPEDAAVVETDDGSSQGTEYEDEEEFNPYAFIKSLPHYDDVKSLCPADRLPAKRDDAPPITLVLDLDETLVHCTVEQVDDADLTFPVDFHGMTYTVHVRLRPYLNQFLEAIADKFEVVVFTASQQVYADALLDLIDPNHEYIKYRMFRESCLPVEGNYLKDLNVLGRDLKKAVLVDNSPHAFGYQVNNGIPIESWFDDKNDTELLKLERFLRTLQNVEDVRPVVRRTFRTYELIANAP